MRSVSVRGGLLLVSLVSIVPALAIIVVTGIQHARQIEESVVEEAHRYVESIVQVHNEQVGSIRQMLTTLARLEPFRERDAEAAAGILADVLDESSEYLNMAVIDTNATVIASPNLAAGTNLAHRRHVVEALRTGGFVVGEYVTALVDDEPSLPFARPIRNRDGTIVGVIGTVYPLHRYAELFAQLGLPDETILGITDYRGIRLFFRPVKETNPVGEPIKQAVWEQMSTGPDRGTVHLAGSDGISRFYAYQRVFAENADQPYLYIVLGVPEAQSTGVAKHILVRNTALMGAVIVAAVVTALLLGGAVFGHRMDRLATTARQISWGDLESRSGINETRSEIGTVAQAIDEMAARLQERAREQQEERLRLSSSLREKEVLLQEVHHRVKNNMQLIMSIVHLQQSSTVDLDEFCERLEARIRAMSFVHELLYQSPDLSTIRIRELLQGLTAAVAQAPNAPRVTVQSEEIALPMERAIPLSLITNELLANAVKHAHNANAPDEVVVSLSRCGGSIELSVRDAGPGFPDGFVPEQSTGLGMRLITALAEQLDGTVSVGYREGGYVTVRVPDAAATAATSRRAAERS